MVQCSFDYMLRQCTGCTLFHSAHALLSQNGPRCTFRARDGLVLLVDLLTRTSTDL